MARYIQDVVLNKPEDFVFFMMNDYLQKNGFTTCNWKGESVYRAGDSFMEGHKYLKWSYANGVFHYEAWLNNGTGKEMGLDGFVACVQKKTYKNNLTHLITLLEQTIPTEAYTQGDGATGSPIPVQTVDNYKSAQFALIGGIAALLFCWSPLICVIISVVTFTQSRMGKCSSKAKLAIAGKICSIIALCITATLYVLNLVFNVMLIAF